FILNGLASSDMFITNKGFKAVDLELITPESTLRFDSLQFFYDEYGDYLAFEDEVIIEGTFDNSNLSIKDLRRFAKLFSTNTFFVQNEDDNFYLDGRLYGKVNSLRAKNFTLRIGNSLRLKGSFSSRNFAVQDEEYLDLQVQQLESTTSTLQKVIPGFSLPPQFNKLGNLDFNGRFSGFFTDFVAYGSMDTDLGRVNLDMNISGLGSRDQAEYSGEMSIEDFNLRSWTGSNDFNRAQLYAKVEQGKGLTLQSVNAQLSGNIEYLEFKGYSYENVDLTGNLSKSLFDGSMSIEDLNADFHFTGTIDFEHEEPSYDFEAEIRRLDLAALNISEQPLEISGIVDIDLVGSEINEIYGEAYISDLFVKGVVDKPFYLDTVAIQSLELDERRKKINLNSEAVDVILEGEFELTSLFNEVKAHLKKNHPAFTKAINLNINDTIPSVQSFAYDIDVKNFTEIGEVFFPDLPEIMNTKVSGYFDNIEDSLSVDLKMPVFVSGNTRIDNIDLEFNSVLDDGFLNVYFDSLATNGKKRISALSIGGEVHLDTLIMELNTLEDDDFNVNFVLAKISDEFNLKLLPEDLRIMGNSWVVNENNEILFSNEVLDIKDIVLSEGDNTVRIQQVGTSGIEISLDQFSASVIDDLWDYEPLDFDGDYKLSVGLQDAFSGKGLYALLYMDTLYINNEDWGSLAVNVSSEDLKSAYDIDLLLERDDRKISTSGLFFTQNVSTMTHNGQPTEYLDFDIDIDELPLKTVEYFIPHIFSNSKGEMDLDANLSGIPANMAMRGSSVIKEGALKVNYLNTTYSFDELNIDIIPGYFDFSDNSITDELGNPALMAGGIGHEVFKDFYYDFSLFSNKMLAFNTEKGDNDVFYGRGIGRVNGSLKGPFKRPEMIINATSLPGSTVYVPLEDSGEVGELDYIVFVSEDDIQEEEADILRDLKGMNIEVNLTITDDTKTYLIFDERAGDVIESKGNANLKFGITRTGEFTMNGKYTIVEGEYLFTLLNIINKPFVVKPGGVISWTGDPYGAELDLSAEYAKLSTSPANFIYEYVATQPELLTEAKQSTDVVLEMILKGQLLSPDIDFNIDFPRLDGQLRNYADSKLRVLSQDENELNRQVFGLIVVGGFLPSDNAGTIQDAQILTGLNTLSELLSNQFSLYITQFLSTAFEDVGFISGVDFDISYNIYQNADLDVTDGSAVTNGSELQFRLKNNLFNDRLQVDLGGNYISSDALGDEFFAGAFAVEYVLTDDRRLKIRFYQRTENALEGRKNIAGIGLSYQKEFDRFSEFLGGMKNTADKVAQDASSQPGSR
ncbi:MAG: translocation/assembly module TamB, partial [Bacteroidia bacterium]|nr:translocation/assembly module TamB [Bacteroidia bacterium]